VGRCLLDLDASLSRNEGDGQERIIDYASEQFETLDPLRAAVDKLADRLSSAELDIDDVPRA